MKKRNPILMIKFPKKKKKMTPNLALVLLLLTENPRR